MSLQEEVHRLKTQVRYLEEQFARMPIRDTINPEDEFWAVLDDGGRTEIDNPGHGVSNKTAVYDWTKVRLTDTGWKEVTSHKGKYEDGTGAIADEHTNHAIDDGVHIVLMRVFKPEETAGGSSSSSSSNNRGYKYVFESDHTNVRGPYASLLC